MYATRRIQNVLSLRLKFWWILEYVCVVLDMDAISLDINRKHWKLYKLLKSAKIVYYM